MYRLPITGDFLVDYVWVHHSTEVYVVKSDLT